MNDRDSTRGFPMVCGYVFISTDLGTAASVADKVGKIKGIESACAVTGDVDVIAHFSVKEVSDIATVVADKIHAIEGVCATQTLICVSCHGEKCKVC